MPALKIVCFVAAACVGLFSLAALDHTSSSSATRSTIDTASVAPGVDTRLWSATERATLFKMSLSLLPPLAPDPSNRVADDARAAELGQQLFFDTRLSGNAKVSCATCHQPALDFQDSIPQGHGMAFGGKRTMPIAGTAHSPWFFWDGRADSQWAQALGPLENPLEHGATRTLVALEVSARYAQQYTAIFGALPETKDLSPQAGPTSDSAGRAIWSRLAPARRESITRVYANVGKAIAAYERRLAFGRSRVDEWIDAERSSRVATVALSADEISGARLFVGKANCATCHQGVRMTDDDFHNTGVPGGRSASGAALNVDDGRATGVRKAVAGEFACTGPYSDARSKDSCSDLRYADTSNALSVRAFKTPSLRNVSRRAPYMDAGQFATLEEVVAHYNRAPRAPLGTTELHPLRLSAAERRQLVAFLRALEANPVARDEMNLGLQKSDPHDSGEVATLAPSPL
jgi:cytochrome c peroxidase